MDMHALALRVESIDLIIRPECDGGEIRQGLSIGIT